MSELSLQVGSGIGHKSIGSSKDFVFIYKIYKIYIYIIYKIIYLFRKICVHSMVQQYVLLKLTFMMTSSYCRCNLTKCTSWHAYDAKTTI